VKVKIVEVGKQELEFVVVTLAREEVEEVVVEFITDSCREKGGAHCGVISHS